MLITAGVTVALCAVMNGLMVKMISRQVRTNYRKNIVEMIPSYADTISLWNANISNGLKMYTESEVVRSGTSAQIVSWMRASKDRRPENVAYVMFVDSDDNAWSDEGGATRVTDRSYYKEIIGRDADSYIDSPVASRLSGKDVLHICAAAYNSKKEKIGFFAADVLIDLLQQKVENEMNVKSGYISVIDGNGRCIINHDPRFRMQDMTHDPEPGADKVVEGMLARRIGMGVIETAYMGPADAYYAPVKGCDWALLFLVPQKQMMGPVVAFIGIAVTLNSILVIAEVLLCAAWHKIPSEKKEDFKKIL